MSKALRIEITISLPDDRFAYAKTVGAIEGPLDSFKAALAAAEVKAGIEVRDIALRGPKKGSKPGATAKPSVVQTHAAA